MKIGPVPVFSDYLLQEVGHATNSTVAQLYYEIILLRISVVLASR